MDNDFMKHLEHGQVTTHLLPRAPLGRDVQV